MAELATIARPYAEALFQVARQHGQVDAALAHLEDAVLLLLQRRAQLFHALLALLHRVAETGHHQIGRAHV